MNELIITIAMSLERATLLRECGNDPVVVGISNHAVYVMTADSEIINRIIYGNIWTTYSSHPKLGCTYVYTGMSIGRVVEHLIDPTSHRQLDNIFTEPSDE